MVKPHKLRGVQSGRVHISLMVFSLMVKLSFTQRSFRAHFADRISMETMPTDHERIARDSVCEEDRRGTQVLLGVPRELLVGRGGGSSICLQHRPSWRAESASGWKQIAIRLDRRSGVPVLEDNDFVQIAQFLPQARRPFSSSDRANDPSTRFPAP